MDNISITDVIKDIIKNNLKIQVTANYNGYVDVELLYDDEVIDSSTCQVITASNPLDE